MRDPVSQNIYFFNIYLFALAYVCLFTCQSLQKLLYNYILLHINLRGRRVHDRMVVRFTTTCAISA